MNPIDKSMRQYAEFLKRMEPYSEAFRQRDHLKEILGPQLNALETAISQQNKATELISQQLRSASIAMQATYSESFKQITEHFRAPVIPDSVLEDFNRSLRMDDRVAEACKQMQSSIAVSASSAIEAFYHRIQSDLSIAGSAAEVLRNIEAQRTALELSASDESDDDDLLIEKGEPIHTEMKAAPSDPAKQVVVISKRSFRDGFRRIHISITKTLTSDAGDDGGEQQAPKLILPPGTSLKAFARRIFSPETSEEVFDEIVASLQEEYFKELAKGAGPQRLRQIQCEYIWHYACAFAHEIWPAIWRVIVAIGVALKIAG